MSDRFPGLGFDPAPGDVTAVDALCTTLERTLQTLIGVRHALHSLGDPGAVWQGQAARAFVGDLTELSPHLERAEQSHRAAHRALATWAEDLRRRQLAARALEERAQAAQRSLLVADQAAELAASRARTALLVGADVLSTQSAAATAGARQHAAQQELDELRRRGLWLQEAHRSCAWQAARAVRAAADVAPIEPGTFERLGSALLAAAAAPFALDERLADWCRDHPHVLAEITDVLADATVAAGVLAVAVPCPATAGIAAGLALATLGGRAVSDAAGADVAASTYLFDALSVGAGGVGAVAALGVRGGLSTLAQGRALGHGGAVAAGGSSAAHYGQRARQADAAAGGGSAASTAGGLAQNTGDDRPFLHFVPDSGVEAAALVMLGPAATGLMSAVDLGLQKDRRAAAQAERDRWNR